MSKNVKDPRELEKELLKDLKIFSLKIERAIIELSMNKNIRLTSVSFGELKPEMNGKLLEVIAIGKLNITEQLLGYRTLISNRDLG